VNVPTILHIEKHFMATETVRDAVIGMTDGLTVPFALAAGVFGGRFQHFGDRHGGARRNRRGCNRGGARRLFRRADGCPASASEQAREESKIDNKRDFEVNEVRRVFANYGLTGGALDSVVASITSDPKRWTDLMMRFELRLERPDPKRAPISAATIANSYPHSAPALHSDEQSCRRLENCDP